EHRPSPSAHPKSATDRILAATCRLPTHRARHGGTGRSGAACPVTFGPGQRTPRKPARARSTTNQLQPRRTRRTTASISRLPIRTRALERKGPAMTGYPNGGASSALNAARRARELTALGDAPDIDVLVIGGGVTGTGVALDAAT